MLPFHLELPPFPSFYYVTHHCHCNKMTIVTNQNFCCYIWFRVSLVMQAYNSWRSKFQRPTPCLILAQKWPQASSSLYFFQKPSPGQFFKKQIPVQHCPKPHQLIEMGPNTSCYSGRCSLKKGDICLVPQVTKSLPPSHTHPTHKFSEPGSLWFSKCTKFITDCY